MFFFIYLRMKVDSQKTRGIGQISKISSVLPYPYEVYVITYLCSSVMTCLLLYLKSLRRF